LQHLQWKEQRKKGRPRKKWKDKVEENLNIMGIKKLANNGQRTLGMKKDYIGNQGPE
jgi:hypothetical protein